MTTLLLAEMKMRTSIVLKIALSTAILLAACDGEAPDEPPAQAPEPAAAAFDDLPVGEVEEMKADGDWGHATTCKPIPDLEPLVDPRVVISLDGLTLHLWDAAGDYDRVFPIGPGVIEEGESLTPESIHRPEGVFWARMDDPPVVDGPTPGEARWGWNHECRMWWTDEDGSKVPVFAGLPFIRLEGPRTNGYGIHGPIDRFTRENGGSLRRGYVSHGCVRMEAADVVELYARMRGHRVPVRIQKAIERRADERAVDVPVEDRWIMSECAADTDCAFEGGFCKTNPYSGRGFCTQRCDRYCPDKDGHPGTFCVEDADAPGEGICAVKPSTTYNNGCARYASFRQVDDVPRLGQSAVKRDVCAPATDGWIGDRCLADAECEGRVCSPLAEGGVGICTEPCDLYCPDKDGAAGTFCVDAPESAAVAEGGMCMARCTSNQDCALGTTCEEEPRRGQAWITRGVCVPY